MKISFKNRSYLFIVFIFMLFVFGILIFHIKEISTEYLFVKDDGIGYYWSKLFWKDSIKNGEFPLWNPYFGCGVPFLADIQQSALSIFNILYLFLDETLAFNLFHILQLLIAGFSMFLLVKEETKQYVVSVIVGFLFAFSIVMGGYRIEHTPIITTVAFFPTIFFCIIRFKNTFSLRWLWLSILIMTIQFYSGFTQIVLYFDIIILLYIIYIFRKSNIELKKKVFFLIQWMGMYILLISAQLIPTIQLMKLSGRNKISWELFSVLAYDFRILLTMFLPYTYKNNIQSFDIYSSSGIDIEIYLGIICLIFLCYTIVYQWKNRDVRIFIIVWVGTFLFGMAPNIYILGKIVYYVPILNSFRVCARSLPIFVFLSLFLVGIGMSKINQKNELLKIIKINIIFVFILTINIFLLWSIFSQEFFKEDMLNREYFYKLKEGMLIAIFLCILSLTIIVFLYYYHESKAHMIMILFLGMIMLLDVERFSEIPQEKRGELESYTSPITIEELKQKIESSKREGYRIFVPLLTPEMKDNTDICKFSKFGRINNEQMLLYNSALTFLDEKLDYWKIKETVFYPKFIQMLKENNDFLSMLGIKYIIDGWKQNINIPVLNENNKRVEVWKKDNLLISKMPISTIEIRADWIQPYTSYLVELKSSQEIKENDSVYVDYYGEMYDSVKQDAYLTKGEDGIYRTILETQEIPYNTDIYFRIVSTMGIEIAISDIGIYEIEAEYRYKQKKYENIICYENTQAQSILYVPTRVISIDKFGDDWLKDKLEEVNKNSYLEKTDKTMEIISSNTKIFNVVIKANSVSADINTKTDTFLNHAQIAYPGWKAYIDGMETKVYTVNNLIQGVYVPKGEHEVIFRFEPLDVKIGIILSIIGLIVFVFTILKNKDLEIQVKLREEVK